MVVACEPVGGAAWEFPTGASGHPCVGSKPDNMLQATCLVWKPFIISESKGHRQRPMLPLHPWTFVTH